MDKPEIENEMQMARIAVYDDFLSSPRIIDIQPSSILEYIEQIASKTYELASSKGGSIPYSVIRQVCENFIHAHFQEPTVSIFDNGNTIRFADQGPGIEDKNRAQLPGFSSATNEMKQYINGVGSGLPIVKEYLSFSNGRLVIEDNLKAGTVITITVNKENTHPEPIIYQETPRKKKIERIDLTDRELAVLEVAARIPSIGPTDIKNSLDLSTATAYRTLESLESKGLIETASNHKRVLTDLGYSYLD